MVDLHILLTHALAFSSLPFLLSVASAGFTPPTSAFPELWIQVQSPYLAMLLSFYHTDCLDGLCPN